MKVAVRLGRKTGADLFVFARTKVVRDDIANKIRRVIVVVVILNRASM